MEVHGDISDQFPPMFTKFREFFEEQQKELFLSFEEQRTEMSNNFTSIVEERNRMIERNMNLIKDLNCEMKDMKTREEIFESENKKLKTELRKTQKELKESKDDFEHFEKHENEEIEELEMKQKIATGLINKLKGDVKDIERKAQDSISEVEEKYKVEKDDMTKEIDCLKEEITNYKVLLNKLTVENEDEKEKTQHLEDEIAKLERKNLTNDEIGTFKVNKEAGVTLDENEELSIHQEILLSSFCEFTFACDQCEKIFSTTKDLKEHESMSHEFQSVENNCNEEIYTEKNISKLQEQISNQREDLIKQIFKVKETEINQKYSCNSSCQPGCKIFHQKHNWIKTESDKLFDRLNKTRVIEKFRCQVCDDQSFGKYSELQKHIKLLHTEVQNEKSVKGLTELEKHLKTVDRDDERKQTSDGLDIFMLKSGSELNKVENCDIRLIAEDSTQFLCRVCFLSFKTEDELKKHLPRHETCRRAPSILKKC